MTSFARRVARSIGLAAPLGLAIAGDAAGQPAAPPPDGAPPPEWFPQAPPPAPPQPDGAYVQEPTSPPPEDPSVPKGEPLEIEAPYVDDAREGALLMGVFSVRPFVTSLDADGAGGSDDPAVVAAGHVGARLHGAGISDGIALRADLEGFLGASTEGVEGEGRSTLAFGLAAEIGGPNFVLFRFGAGGALTGNPSFDYQLAELPMLEVGYVHIGADGFIEVAPRAAMAVTRMAAFDTGVTEPDPAPAGGGRLLAGGDALWSTLDVLVVSGEQPLAFGVLTACFAERFSVCLDGRLATGSLDFPGPGRERLVALSGGLAFGLGVAEVER